MRAVNCFSDGHRRHETKQRVQSDAPVVHEPSAKRLHPIGARGEKKREHRGGRAEQ
jgi:hypothetical protein